MRSIIKVQSFFRGWKDRRKFFMLRFKGIIIYYKLALEKLVVDPKLEIKDKLTSL